MHIEDEAGNNLTGAIPLAPSGGFQAWTTVNSTATLTAGQHILKVVVDFGGFNLDDMTFGTATGTPAPTATPLPTPVSGNDIDWPTQGFDTARDGYNPNETQLNSATVSGLQLQWSQRIAGDATSKYANSQPVVAAGVSVNGVPTDIVMAGDEHGYFSAYNASGGALLWRKALGSVVTTCGDIPDKTFGITGSAAIDHANSRVYVVDGTGVLWAFDLATGNLASGWPAAGVSVVDDPSIDHVWSALTFNASTGTLYVPTASYCDFSQWHGALRAVSTQAAAVTNVYYFATGTSTPPVSSGVYGGGVWSWGGISIDTATQNVYAATGNTSSLTVPSGASNESLTQWNPQLGLLGNFFPQIGNGDLDFGGSAVLYNVAGSQCVAAYRKSGQLFAFDRTNINAGPTTTWQIGGSGISSPAFSPQTGMLYFNNPNAGALPQGLYAIRSGSGCVLNQTPAWSVNNINTGLQPLTVAGSVVYDITGSTINAYDASSGTPLWNSARNIVSFVGAGATVVNGHVYVVDWNDTLYSFGLPAPVTTQSKLRRAAVPALRIH